MKLTRTFDTETASTRWTLEIALNETASLPMNRVDRLILTERSAARISDTLAQLTHLATLIEREIDSGAP